MPRTDLPMRPLKSTLHSVRAVLSIAAAFTVFTAHVRADARPPAAGNGPLDACEQGLRSPGKSEGLNRRCKGPGASGGAAKGDFNGDGFADLAIGVPFEDQDGVNAVGAVNVIYGSAAGLTPTGTTAPNDQFFDETTFGFSYRAGDNFGWALASGDFNGDDRSDLAIGMPGADVDGINDAGHVLLIDGSDDGLDASTARILPLLDTQRRRAGEALVWGDFNGDGAGDLAVGIPDAFATHTPSRGQCLFTAIESAGEVQVFYGGVSGLTEFGAQLFGQNTSVCPNFAGGVAETGDRFGAVLAAGNFNGDTLNGNPVSDLVVGVPLDFTRADLRDAGSIHLFPGSATGLRRDRVQVVNQATVGVGGASEPGDQFGRALASGDFDADGRDDLAVGVPFEDLIDNTRADAGAVQVFFGGGSSLVDAAGDVFISQSDLSGEAVEAGDRFGFSLAVGKFDIGPFADLAIGVPGEDISNLDNVGLVHVLHGSSSGLSLTRIQHWHQNSAGVPDSNEVGDQFGFALSAWNFGSGGASDLAIGIPFEDIVSATGRRQADAGAVIVIYGSVVGLNPTTRAAQFWHQNAPGIKDEAQSGDRFGNSLY